MAEESNVWEGVRDLLERIEERMDAAFPAEGISVTPADAIALGIYSRCVSLFRSIVLLLSNNQPEEALMLWRSLFTDSLRMRELAAVGKEDRIPIELGHYAYSLERTKQRFQQAKKLGVTDDITSELAHSEDQKRAMENYRKRLGIEKLKRFSSEENLIKKLNLNVDLWAFLYSHAFVHGEDIAQTFRRRKIQTNVLAFFSHNADPGLLAAVGLTAAQSAIDTHEAAGQMFGWQVSTEFQKLIEDLDDLQRRLNARSSQNSD
jgi:hypothetical protein